MQAGPTKEVQELQEVQETAVQEGALDLLPEATEERKLQACTTNCAYGGHQDSQDKELSSMIHHALIYLIYMSVFSIETKK